MFHDVMQLTYVRANVRSSNVLYKTQHAVPNPDLIVLVEMKLYGRFTIHMQVCKTRVHDAYIFFFFFISHLVEALHTFLQFMTMTILSCHDEANIVLTCTWKMTTLRHASLIVLLDEHNASNGAYIDSGLNTSLLIIVQNNIGCSRFTLSGPLVFSFHGKFTQEFCCRTVCVDIFRLAYALSNDKLVCRYLVERGRGGIKQKKILINS